MNFNRRFTANLKSPYDGLKFVKRRSEIRNPDGSLVFALDDVKVPEGWSQVATDIIAQKYFRKAGVPAKTTRVREKGVPTWIQRRQMDAKALDKLEESDRYGTEKDSRQVFDRLAGCWTY